MTALEAMACGAALACSARGGLAEVTSEAAVPIDPDDIGSVAAALLRLAGDPSLRASLSAAGQRRARRCFDSAAACARLDAVRDQAVAAWRGHSSPASTASRRS
jgi:alpha-1,3-rhamnosyl/mannosyltransferase